MPKQTIRAMLKHAPSMMLKHCSSNAINERTNVTDVQLLTLSINPTLVIARRGVARFLRTGDEQPRAAALRAGSNGARHA